MMILNDNEPEAGAGFQYAGCQDRVLVETMRGLLLSLPTFGLYWCWAANRLRRHLWSSLRVLGGALEYRGSGAERLRGLALFVVSHVAFLAALLMVARLAGESASHPLPTMIYLCFGLALLTLVPAALYRARRYRLRCTSWRGMTADLEGSGLSFALLWTLWTLLGMFSLGLAWPVRNARLVGYVIDRTRLGELRCTFDGKARHLFRLFFKTWAAAMAVALPALMMAWPVLSETLIAGAPSPAALAILSGLMVALAPFHLHYRAEELRYLCSHIGWGPLHLEMTQAPPLSMMLGNALVTVLTLGAGRYWGLHRLLRHFAATARLRGDLPSALQLLREAA